MDGILSGILGIIRSWLSGSVINGLELRKNYNWRWDGDGRLSPEMGGSDGALMFSLLDTFFKAMALNFASASATDTKQYQCNANVIILLFCDLGY
jgi:hypothetical protein